MIHDVHQADLDRLDASARLRRLIIARGVDFSSNDYLGLRGSTLLKDAAAAALDRGVPIGSGGSRLLGGNHLEHEALEAEAAAFFGCQSTLYFSSGYAANSALLATLPQRGDCIFFDELVHASAHEGIKLSRAAAVGVAHNDAEAFADAVSRWRKGGGTGQIWLVVESLYSMDGDVAPLDALMALADAQDGVLIVDEAHATGVFGPNGVGLAGQLEGRDNFISLRTCGKALGCEGALICGPKIVRDFLINRARSFIFSTAPSPLMAATVRAGLQILRDQPERREQLWSLIRTAEMHLVPLGATPSSSQIMPLVVGEDAQTMRVAASVQNAGYDVRGIRPPTVPVGTSRLRISITLNTSEEHIAGLANAIQIALQK